MSYVNWSEVLTVPETYHWYRMSDVTHYLYEVTKFVETRSAAKDSPLKPPRLKYFSSPLINSAKTRFPETEVVLCFEFGSWKTEIDLLQLSITVMCNPSRLERGYPDYKTVDEAKSYALGKVSRILKCVDIDCWKQKEFERHFNLLWVESTKDATCNKF